MKRRAIVTMVLLTCLLLSGSIFKQKEMNLSTDQIIFYQNNSVESFLILANSNQSTAKKMYQDACILFLGTLRSKSDNNKTFSLGSNTAITAATISCVAADDDVRQELSELQVGNYVKAYGKLTCSALDGRWTFTVDKIEKTVVKKGSPTVYSRIDGTTCDTEKMLQREIKNGRVKFLIPPEWESAERDVVKDSLGSMEGYQYRLNEVGRKSVWPESIFICYFDNGEHLLNSADKNETERIERAIVKNILDVDPGAPDLKKVTYYNASYHYYQSVYETASGQDYRAEFVFQPDGTDGMVVYLYVFREKEHLDDVMMTMMTLTLE